MSNYDTEELEAYRALGLTPMEIAVDLKLLADLTRQNIELKKEVEQRDKNFNWLFGNGVKVGRELDKTIKERDALTIKNAALQRELDNCKATTV